nr:chorismate synthase [Maliibacterium massiliense]
MSNVWGNNLKISIFGESHGAGIGVVVGGLPAGLALDFEQINRHMARRAPGRDAWSTPRREADQVRVLSGVLDGHTTGAPLCGIIENTNTRAQDYQKLDVVPRPGHADYAAHIKYQGHNDVRGGGHFSGRLTAPLLFAGSVARQLLAKEGVCIGAHIARIAGVTDSAFDPVDTPQETLEALTHMPFAVLEREQAAPMQACIEEARRARDSVGGAIEVMALGVPAGLGDPFFDSFESVFAHLAYSVPAVKAVAFGAGEGFGRMHGSQANDPFIVREGRVATRTNHTGGVNGGITNGMPVVARVTFRPTSSIARAQDSVNLATGKMEKLEIHGRHDPCIVPRAVPVLEACMALTIADLMLGGK